MSGTTHIIGAGLAGLSCALKLAQSGRGVALYEAARMAGGRCRSYYDSTLDLTIDIASIDTPSDKLEGELKEPFFEVSKFPTATFKSTSIKVTGKNEGEITGNLTLHGVTKPVTLKTTFNGGTQHPFANAYAIGFSSSTKINQGDFKFPAVAWRGFVADEITIYAEAELVQDK